MRKMNVNSVFNEVTLDDIPHGTYNGVWNGYEVTIDTQFGVFVIHVDDGVRGLVPCFVHIGEEFSLEVIK